MLKQVDDDGDDGDDDDDDGEEKQDCKTARKEDIDPATDVESPNEFVSEGAKTRKAAAAVFDLPSTTTTGQAITFHTPRATRLPKAPKLIELWQGKGCAWGPRKSRTSIQAIKINKLSKRYPKLMLSYPSLFIV